MLSKLRQRYLRLNESYAFISFMSALARAKEAAGGPTALGRAIDLTPQAVSLWKEVPAKHVLAVERITGISRHELRPDIYGPAPAKTKRKAA